MKKSLIYVDQSAIHGKGLFARKAIGAGEIIGAIRGEPTSIDGEHVLWLDESCGIHVHCELRYINHSDVPNAAYYDTQEVWALKDIAAGEESPMTTRWMVSGDEGIPGVKPGVCPSGS